MEGVTAQLLALYDEQLRGAAETAVGVESDTDGPLIRIHYPHRGFVSYRSLAGLAGAELDAVIARQVSHFAERGEVFEWKTRGHDLPADLPDRLMAAGFVPEQAETVLVGDAAAMAAEPVLPVGVRLERALSLPDFQAIAAMESTVWGEDWAWLADDLQSRTGAVGTAEVFVALAGAEVVSAAWIVFKQGTDFAGLWGGSTVSAWRGQGIYRAMVARRAQRAAERGVRYLQVDASTDSRPILERLGFVAITTTTPYVWTPPYP
ncbi:MAG: GNAT family N-acetyltransferase [Jatrophihabitantaceae bacterium]